MSLDGYIATEDGGYDWIPDEPAIDRGAFMARFDTVLLGRKTYETMVAQGQGAAYPGMRHVVFSRTLEPVDHPDVEIAADIAAVRDLRLEEGQEIWLVGGGELFRVGAVAVEDGEGLVDQSRRLDEARLLPADDGELHQASRHRLILVAQQPSADRQRLGL